MILYNPENGSYSEENNISSDWQRGNIFEAGFKFSIQLQRVTGLDLQCRLICYPDIRY